MSFAGRRQISQDHMDLGSSLTRSTPHMQQRVSVKQGHARGFVLSRGARLPLDLFFLCSVSHSPLPNKVELSAERGGLPDGSPQPILILRYPPFVSFLFFFCFLPLCLLSLFASFTFKSVFTSLFIPVSHRTPRYMGGIPRTLYAASATAYGTSAAPGSSGCFCLVLLHVRLWTCLCERLALQLPS